MMDFVVDRQLCVQCGACVGDCPTDAIAMVDLYPAAVNEPACIKCQHCLAVCPQGAISIFGRAPGDSMSLEGRGVDPDKLERLMKGRRSVRQYRQTNVEPEIIRRLLDVAWHAPTGQNRQQVRFTVVDNRETMADIRAGILDGLERLVREGKLNGNEFFGNFPREWKENGKDILFRGAPHLLVTSVPAHGVSPMPDCLIAMSYFELFAQSLGLGTVWDGIARHAIDLVPETKARLGIPEDHVIGFLMAFGWPLVGYARTVQRGAPDVSVVK